MTAPRVTELRDARRILVCLRWGIGDLVMELPALHALRRAVPEAHITGLGAPPAIELLAGEACVDDIVSVAGFGFRHWGDIGDARSRQRMAEWCQAFDCVVDGSHAARGVQLSLGQSLTSFDTGAWLRRRARAGAGLDVLAQAVRASWGVDPGESRPHLVLRREESAAGRGILEALRLERPLLAVAAGASSALKRGAAAEFARAADRLVAASGCSVLELASPDDCGRAASLMTRSDRARVVAAGHLRRTAALLAESDVLLCNDSGLMHLAAAVDVPVVSVFACTSPRLYLPPGGTAVMRWQHPCAYPEATPGGFGVTPCIEAGRCLQPQHHPRLECWASAAADAALPHLRGSATAWPGRR